MVSVAALVVLGIAVGTASPAAPTSGPAALKTGKAGGVTVLTNASGLTVYTFAADAPGKSNCYGSCASYWPPVTGSPSVAPGIPGTFGTITRTGGIKQVTWNGHPLYTYVGDRGPGQASGNNLNLNGGLWHEIVVHGLRHPARAEAPGQGAARAQNVIGVFTHSMARRPVPQFCHRCARLLGKVRQSPARTVCRSTSLSQNSTSPSST